MAEKQGSYAAVFADTMLNHAEGFTSVQRNEPSMSKYPSSLCRPRGARALRKKMIPYMLLAPVLIFIFCFLLVPIVNVFSMSLENYKATRPNARAFAGLGNYVKIFTKDAVFTKSLINTLRWVVISVVIQTVLGFWLAYVLNKKFHGRGLVRALTLAPWAVAGVMVGIIWKLILGETYGLLNDVLKRLNIITTNVSWFSSASLATFSCILANVWRGIPFFTISYLSALSSIPDDLYESARIDGASAPRVLFSITLPMIKDTIIVTTLLRSIWTFNAVDLIVSMTDGGPNRGTTTLALYIMNKFSMEFDYGYASALAVIATLMMMVLALVYLKFGKLGKDGIN